MYNNNHKRMLPKREDAYRTEFPGNYYSSSSVYSYSPTSTSDCPEHGGSSRRRTTWILVTSVVLATLGVLSIAGIAAYLGIISKNISNNASQYEESYLQSNTSGNNNRNDVGSSSEEDGILYNHGRSKDESGFIDLTNSLADTNTGLGPPGDDDLINHQGSMSKQPEIVADNGIKIRNPSINTRPPEIVHGTKLNSNTQSKRPNPSPPIHHISAKPMTVIVKSTSTSSSTSFNNSGTNLKNNYYNPVDMIPPPIRGGGNEEGNRVGVGSGVENAVTYFTEEPTSTRIPTRVPSRNADRNRNRFPVTNSHSLTPTTSTTTIQVTHEDPSSMESGNSKDQNQSSNTVKSIRGGNTHVSSGPSSSPTPPSDGRYRSTMHKPNSHHGLSGGVRESVVHVTPSDAKKVIHQQSQQKIGQKNSNQESFAKRHGLVNIDEDATTFSPNNGHNVEGDETVDPHRASHNHHHQKQHSNNNNHSDNYHSHQADMPNNSDVLKHGKGDSSRSPVQNNHQMVHHPHNNPNHELSHKPEHFIPITPIISAERAESDNNDELLNNHKMPQPISFDRVSSDFYDKNPWTPLLDRPNLDKRPRVEINKPTASPEPVIVWNTEYSHDDDFRVNPAPPQPLPPQNYYGYGHTAPGPSSSGHRHKMQNQDAKPNPSLKLNDNEPISHALNTVPHLSTTESATTTTTPASTTTTLNSNSKTALVVGVNNNNSTVQSGAAEPDYTEEETGGFRPLAIPSYTVIIPHIPNNFPTKVLLTPETSKGGVIGTGHQQQPEEEDRNLNTSYKFDRVGLVELVDDSGEPQESSEERKSGHDHDKTKKGTKNNAEEIKDGDDYGENDELLSGDGDGDNLSPTKIYKLDPDTVDIVPDPFGNKNDAHMMESQDLKKPPSNPIPHHDFYDKSSPISTSPQADNNRQSVEQETTPKLPDPIVKSTTDLIMSTLGSLNLIKSSPPTHSPQSEIESKLRASDGGESNESLEMKDSNINGSSETSRDSPLFPPVRSYVGVNLPLRPKPSPASLTEDEEEMNDSGDEEEEEPYYVSTNHAGTLGNDMQAPTMSNDPGDSVHPTVSSLQKVLSMMMKFEGEGESEESGRDLKVEHQQQKPPSFVNITKQNVNLLLAKVNESLSLHSVKPHPSSTPTPTSTHREQKSYNTHRHSKIDEQFAPPSNIEHVPVPLIVTSSPHDNQEQERGLLDKPEQSQPGTKVKLTNVTVNDQNSPVYKFVLRQGQAIEELLREIFQNYTDVQGESVNSQVEHLSTQLGSSRPLSYVSNNSFSGGGASLKSLDDNSKLLEQTTQNGIGGGLTFTNVKISHHTVVDGNGKPVPQPLTIPQISTTTTTTTPSSSSSSSDPPVFQTSTSIVISDEECPKNTSFQCVSTGRCIPSYLRCNFIKECPDNSDENNCSCADFLRANGNGRKLCDGVVDCADASDEYAYCEYCKPGQYICAGSRSCINKSQICDSRRDCPSGDDENDCVKIGQSPPPAEGAPTDLEEFSSTYNKNGHLMVRKKGVWGKLCVDTFSSVVSHWEVKDLARAVCKALTFSDFESVERIQDKTINSTDPYYELFYGISNNDTEDSSRTSDEKFSSESTPRVGLGFKKTECKSKLVVNVTCQDLQCGTAPKSFTQTARIVGGANSMPGKWPWQAALYKNGEFQCGATLISSRWLLSAGHCFHNAQDDYWVARLGTLRRGATVLSPYEQVVKITHIFLHPQYQNVGFVNDVSLLRLEKEVNFTDYVRPVCLPSRENKIRDGRMCTVVGWGQLFEVGRVFPDTLQEVQLPLISTTECRKRTLFLPLYKLTEQMFCAGFDRGGRDACLGDSGGPMMCQETDGRWSLYGVTSNGYGCARANRPGVYTKVASYLDWINDKMNLENSFAFKEKAKYCPGHRCLLGECLDRRQVCNGIVDCTENGSDERGPNCTTHLGLVT